MFGGKGLCNLTIKVEAPWTQIADVANRLYDRKIAGKAVLHVSSGRRTSLVFYGIKSKKGEYTICLGRIIHFDTSSPAPATSRYLPVEKYPLD